MLMITIHLISFTYFETQEGDDGNMVYVNEKGKVDISREGKFMSVMPPGKSLKHVSQNVINVPSDNNQISISIVTNHVL